jgi:DNA ligase-1
MVNDAAARRSRAVSARAWALTHIVSDRLTWQDTETPFKQPLELIPGMTAASEPCQLVQPFEASKFPRNAIAEPKFNGIRANYLLNRVLTRNALPMDCAIHCLPFLTTLEQAFRQPMFIDGEYVEDDGIDATLAAHRAGIGAGTFYVFDAVPLHEWQSNRFTQPHWKRKENLLRAFTKVPTPQFVERTGWTSVESAEQAMLLARDTWERGGEGIVVKNADHLYVRGKSWASMKIKQKLTCEAVVVDAIVNKLEPKAWRPAHLMGGVKAFLVRVEGTDEVVKIGTMPDWIRLEASRDHMKWQGRMLEIEYEELVGGKMKGAHILHPRPDKEKADA